MSDYMEFNQIILNLYNTYILPMKTIEERKKLYGVGDKRGNHEVDEAMLGSWPIHLVAVIKHANRNAILYNFISLYSTFA